MKKQAQVDAERATIAPESAGQAVSPGSLRRFAQTARRRVRDPEGGYSRDHLRTLAQPVEVAEGEVRIMGFVPKWRPTLDEGEHYVCAVVLR